MEYQTADRQFAETLRAAAETHDAAQINLQTLVFQQGRDIARAYIDMMKSYARLSARSGNFQPTEGGTVVSGFCRIEQEHFGKEPVIRQEKRQTSIWTSTFSELKTRRFSVVGSDLFAAFCTGFAEFCAAEGIRTGALSVLVRKKDGTAEVRTLPAEIHGGEFAESFGYPYEIRF
jgi:hypothetical protein